MIEYFRYCLNEDGTSYSIGINSNSIPEVLTIPKEYNNRLITRIMDFGFTNCIDLKVINIPSTIKQIGSFAFKNCRNLLSIIIPESMEIIDFQAFHSCNRLEAVYILSKNIIKIDSTAFSQVSEFFKLYIPLDYLYDSRYCYSYGSNNWGIFYLPEHIPTDLYYFDFTLNEDKSSYAISANKQENYPKRIVLPNVFHGLPITTIAEYGFSKNSPNIESIIFNSNLKVIKSYALKNQENITDIIIPRNVERIEDEAFRYALIIYGTDFPTIYSDSKLETVQFEYGSKLSYIGTRAFYGNMRLKEITLPDNVTTISEGAFYYTGIKYLKIPKAVADIGVEITSMCRDLEDIIVDPDNRSYKSINSCLYTKDGSILLAYPNDKKDGIFIIDSNTIKIASWRMSCPSYSLKLIISNPITPPAAEDIVLESNYFKDIPILVPDESVDLYKNTAPWKKYSDNIFPLGCFNTEESMIIQNNKLIKCLSTKATIIISDNITEINDSAFNSCTGLEGVYVNENNTNFKSIDGVLFNSDMTKLLCYPQGRKDGSYIVPESVIKLENFSFYNAQNLVKITFDKNLTTIGDYAFYCCYSLGAVQNESMIDHIKELGRYAFFRCSQLSVFKFQSLEKISSGALDTCVCPSERTEDYFICNSNLYVNLGPNIKEIESSPFPTISDYNTVVVTIEARTPPKLISDSIYKHWLGKCIYVPLESLDLYKKEWGEYDREILPIGTDISE